MTPLTREQIAGMRELLAKATLGPWRVDATRHDNIKNVAGCGNSQIVCCTTNDAEAITAAINALPALLDIAEAVANGLTCEVRECCGHVIIGNEWDDDYATNKLIGKRVAVLPLAGEVA